MPRTIDQIGVWASTTTLFAHAAAVDPRAVVPRVELAEESLREHDAKGALRNAEAAIALAPNTPAVVETLAAALLANGDDAEAERALRAVLAAYPDRPRARLLLEDIARRRERAPP